MDYSIFDRLLLRRTDALLPYLVQWRGLLSRVAFRKLAEAG